MGPGGVHGAWAVEWVAACLHRSKQKYGPSTVLPFDGSEVVAYSFSAAPCGSEARLPSLGNRFSGLVAIQPGHKLLTSGIYSVIRHPSYLGLLLNSLGWSLAFRAGAGVVVTVLLIPPSSLVSKRGGELIAHSVWR